MIKKYTRKQINQQASLHGAEFVTYDDCVKALELFMVAAVNAGADVDKMMADIGPQEGMH